MPVLLTLFACTRFTPDARDVVHFVDDPELRYVMQRYREVHDFLHALTGLPPTVLGELALKWFEMVQTELPSTTLAAFAGPLRLPPRDMVTLATVYVPWASRAAAESEWMMVVPFEKYLTRDVEDVRRVLRLTPAPTLP